ncbi:GPI mannosyltransferase 2, putative [Plasmodium gaboni]|uniref:GPI mannosyltransferase 2 n=1 Tax=Plasmodium gaboni TaxID=647221 RepID=A0ABY1URY3_9APIC|nr:GPI mannosyltransferase 2, putative [Plasmodium gaboni]
MHKEIKEEKKELNTIPKYKNNTIFYISLICIITILSRIFCIINTVIWSKVIKPYKFSNNLLCEEKNGESILWNMLKCFSYWDGEYFLRLSLNGTEYNYEQNHAFFPTLPLIIIYIKKILTKYYVYELTNCVIHILIMLVLNNFFFLIATIGIFVYSLIHFKNENYDLHEFKISSRKQHNCYYSYKINNVKESYRFSFFISILYAFSIGNIHASSFYNESIFSCFSIWGFNFLQLCLYSQKKKKQEKKIYIYEILCILCFAICSFFRSNGILFLIPVFFFNIQSCELFQKYLQEVPKKDKGKSETMILFNHFNNKFKLLTFIIHWIKALIEAIIIVLPFFIFQLYAYNLYCTEKNELLKEENKKFYVFFFNLFKDPNKYVNMWNNKKSLLINRPWCNNIFPFIYNYIQYKYWDVKIFKCLFSPNFNILYSAPVYFISFHCIYTFIKKNKCTYNKLSLLNHHLWGDVIHLFVLSLYILLCAHTEIILRLIISCPMFYLHYGYLLRYFEKWNYLFFINLLYFFVGPALFGTYIAWT